jgi:hypothetical protein
MGPVTGEILPYDTVRVRLSLACIWANAAAWLTVISEPGRQGLTMGAGSRHSMNGCSPRKSLNASHHSLIFRLYVTMCPLPAIGHPGTETFIASRGHVASQGGTRMQTSGPRRDY